MKLSTQMAVVIVAAIGGLVVMIYLLTAAGRSTADVIGLVTGIGTAVALLIAAIRNQVKTDEKVEQVQMQVGAGQRDVAERIDQVVQQTNGDLDRRIRAGVSAVLQAQRQADTAPGGEFRRGER